MQFRVAIDSDWVTLLFGKWFGEKLEDILGGRRRFACSLNVLCAKSLRQCIALFGRYNAELINLVGYQSTCDFSINKLFKISKRARI
jgi:hypothetical protein